MADGRWVWADRDWWQHQKEIGNELKRYKKKLYKATFNNNEAQRFREKGDTANAVRFHDKSESFCEEALEISQEIVAADALVGEE